MTPTFKNYIFFIVILFLSAFVLYLMFHSDNSEMDKVKNELNEAREKIKISERNIDSILLISEGIIAQNAIYNNYINSIDSIISYSDKMNKIKEQKHIKTINQIEEKLLKLKFELSKMHEQLPEPENGKLDIK